MRIDMEYITKTVKIGNIEIGGGNPVAIQSMTNTNTLDTNATVEQIISIIKIGADIVRISTPTIKDAENLKNIKQLLGERGFAIPLVADIHFNPKIAEIAARVVEKIRINPGNFSDKKPKVDNYISDSFFQKEFEIIKKYFIPLIKTCKQYNTVIRIGVNHGSLSEKIINKYGDTPTGMVESAMEYIQICKDEDFHNIVLSLKSSNTRVMVYANRLLFEKMKQSGVIYPLHIGVTEAGSGDSGRLKSAVGIGALLSEGIGNTIRVSLTESPESEIPVAKQIVKYSNNFISTNTENSTTEFTKRKTNIIGRIGGDNKFRVINESASRPIIDKYLSEDFFYTSSKHEKHINRKLNIIVDFCSWSNANNSYPIFDIDDFLSATAKSEILNFASIPVKEFSQKHINKLKEFKTVAIVLSSTDSDNIDYYYNCFTLIEQNNLLIPVIIKRTYNEKSLGNLQIKCATEIGRLLIDGLAEGLWLSNYKTTKQDKISELSYNLLQASRIRFSKPEYISCPTCSRTLFDIEKICKEIKERTANIKSIKIAVMGCIVNGPGEMADADYGYVGSGKEKVSIYKSREIIKQNIPQANAIDELISLIKENGDWKL